MAEAKKVNAALMAPCKLAPELEAVVGPGPMPRSEMTKKIWEYIKANGLQDSANKRMINADAKLLVLFGGKKQVSMFEMTKLLSPFVSKA